jgi:chromosome segregation ATPase
MSTDNAAKIQQALDRVDPNNTSDWLRQCRVDAQRALDALRAEHRAEVDTLRRNLADAQQDASANAHEAESLKASLMASEAEHRAQLDAHKKIISVARDAALEEGAIFFDAMQEQSPEPMQHRTVASTLRSMQSSPVSVLPVDKVRDVLREHLFPGVFARVMAALGVDLDAKAGPVSAPPRKESERECTCTGSCRGADGLGFGWRCALQR